MKKVLSVLLIAVLALGLFAACGGNDDTEGSICTTGTADE